MLVAINELSKDLEINDKFIEIYNQVNMRKLSFLFEYDLQPMKVQVWKGESSDKKLHMLDLQVVLQLNLLDQLEDITMDELENQLYNNFGISMSELQSISPELETLNINEKQCILRSYAPLKLPAKLYLGLKYLTNTYKDKISKNLATDLFILMAIY